MPSQELFVCEYGTVDAFLTALSEPGAAEVFLAPIHRSVRTSSVQVGALLSGQRSDESSRVHTCIVLAAEAVLDGAQGRITYPYRQTHNDRQARQHVSDLQQELLTVLHTVLQHEARIAHLRYPASYRVPPLQLWNHDALIGFPITYQGEHWIAAPNAPNPPS